MERADALQLWLRLLSHYPQLGGEPGDPVAETRANDWLNFFARQDFAPAFDAIETIITNPDRPRFIGIGDVQGVLRQRVSRDRLAEPQQRALNQPVVTEDVARGGIAACRATLPPRP